MWLEQLANEAREVRDDLTSNKGGLEVELFETWQKIGLLLQANLGDRIDGVQAVLAAGLLYNPYGWTGATWPELGAEYGSTRSKEALEILRAAQNDLSASKHINRSGTPGKLRLKDGRYWVPLIALYAGMRAGEIIQLTCKDVRQENGVFYFDVTKLEDDPDEEIKHLKTGSSYRKVPVHSAVLELGFLEYAATRKTGRLFAELKMGSDGTYSQPWSKFWCNLGNKWKFRSKLHVFHSFRHNFVDALHEANVTDAIAMQICGHTSDDAHWGYGKGASISRLKDEIEKIEYPGLHLGHATGPGWKI